MSDLISRKKIRDYIKGEINPYGKPFEGTEYELGLKIMRYIDAMDSAYDVENVVEELKNRSKEYNSGVRLHGKPEEMLTDDAIEIVKQGGVADDVCEQMRADGIVRRFDYLGRIFIPREFRKQIFGTPEKSEGMPMEIFMDKDNIILRKYEENVDDVCEWKVKSNYYVTECSHDTDVMYGLKQDFKFCPYCGKKIKIVGD